MQNHPIFTFAIDLTSNHAGSSRLQHTQKLASPILRFAAYADKSKMLYRAFELAGSAQFQNAEIRRQLIAEGFGEGLLGSQFDTFSTRHALAEIFKFRFTPPPFSWISK